MEACIEVEDLSKTYGSGRTARTVLEECSFSVERGKLTALVGKSGCGKTTLLRILGGLLPADQGIVKIDGEEIQDKTDAELSDYRAQKTGFILALLYFRWVLESKNGDCHLFRLMTIPLDKA